MKKDSYDWRNASDAQARIWTDRFVNRYWHDLFHAQQEANDIAIEQARRALDREPTPLRWI